MSSFQENVRWFWRELNAKPMRDPHPLSWCLAALCAAGEGFIIVLASGTPQFPYAWYINLPLTLIIFTVFGYGFGLFLFYFAIPFGIKLRAIFGVHGRR